jgi:nucleotide-binding universal stress UspA family protein
MAIAVSVMPMPQVFKNILCPVDFDSGSAEALDLAATFAQQNNASLHVIHVVLVPASGLGYPAEPYKRLEKVQQVNLEKWVDAHVPACVSSDSIVRIGNPAEAIVAAADKLGVDMIVMATRGRKGLSRAIFGSVAEGVLRNATQAVLLVKPKARVSRTRSATRL